MSDAKLSGSISILLGIAAVLTVVIGGILVPYPGLIGGGLLGIVAILVGLVEFVRAHFFSKDVEGPSKTKIFGGILCGCVALGLVPFILGPTMSHDHAGADERRAIAAMRSILVAQLTFQADAIVDVDSVAQFGTFEQLTAGDTPYVDAETVNGEEFGYAISMELIPGANPGFEVTAVPLDSGDVGPRSFYVDESGVIRATDQGTADSDSTPIE